MKKILKGTSIFILLLFTVFVNAQQIPLYTQYIFNNFVYNPAIAGTHNYYQIRSNTRVQWVGVTDHPLTNVLSVYGPSKKKDMGFGGYLYSDVTGPTSRSGINGAYAYNLMLTEQMRLSMGLSVGVQQYKVDGSNIQLWSEKRNKGFDPLANQVYSKMVPDAAIGVYLYTYSYHVGLSSTQLLNNKLNFLDIDTLSGISKLKSHFYLSGGYRYIINKMWSVEPTAMIKVASPTPFQFDLSARAYYKNMVWGGLSVRTKDAISIMLGYIHEKQYYFGYSYDYSFTAIRSYTSGSHEITIGYRFNDIKK